MGTGLKQQNIMREYYESRVKKRLLSALGYTESKTQKVMRQLLHLFSPLPLC